jgi:hypothetical protein
MHKRITMTALLLGMLILPSIFSSIWPTQSAAVAESAGPELAVYEQGLALVKETRTLQLAEGVQSVTIPGVAALIDPTSVQFRSLTDPAGTAVLEQNFEYDVVGTDKLLEKYVNQPIQVITADGTVYDGTLLNGAGDIILQDNTGKVQVVSRDQVRDFTFPQLPEGLSTKPTLSWLVDAQKAGTQDAEITYLTNGIGWQANYVALLSADNKQMDLNGWITLDNHSGATYEGAKLKLVAGAVHQASQPQAKMALETAMGTPQAAPAVQQRNFFEYYLYEIQRPVTIKDKQTKQIEFVTAPGVPTEKFFVYDGTQNYNFFGSLQADPTYGANTGVSQVKTMLQFNTGKEGTNAELPAGIVRVYQQDVDGSSLLIGEDNISHTAKDEDVRLYLGDAFDIEGTRVQTDFKKVGNNVIEESYEITVRNHKTEDVEVRVDEHLFRWSDWEIVKESAQHAKLDAQTVEWRVKVPAGGESKVTYTVRYTW